MMILYEKLLAHLFRLISLYYKTSCISDIIFLRTYTYYKLIFFNLQPFLLKIIVLKWFE